jgi:hypothetical protein
VVDSRRSPWRILAHRSVRQGATFLANDYRFPSPQSREGGCDGKNPNSCGMASGVDGRSVGTGVVTVHNVRHSQGIAEYLLPLKV